MTQAAPVHVSLKAKLLAALVAVVLAAGLCEVAARVVYTAPPDPVREPQLMYESHPELGFFHVPGQTGYLDDGLATINEMGLRGERPAVPKPVDELRIFAIGDSTTFGWGVEDDETYVALLEQRLREARPDRHVTVVNGGVGAYDIEREARLLEHFAPVLQPDLVLVGLYWNDLPYERATPEGDRLAPRRSSPTSASARRDDRADGEDEQPRRQFRIGNNPSTLNRLLRRSRLLYVLRQTWLSAVATTEAADNLVRWEMALLEGRESPAIDEAWQEIAESLEKIRRTGEAHGFPVGVLIIPIRAQVEQPYPDAAYQTRARTLAEAKGFLVIDPLPKFLETTDKASLFIPYDRMHLSAAGNALLAEALFEDLSDRVRLDGIPVEAGPSGPAR